MLRNDYRKSLILLRSNASGYSGHVRLERRTLTGSMTFIVQTPDSTLPLKAALIGRGRNGSFYACALGELKKDIREQTALSLRFDPRDLCGRELERYRWIAVAEVSADACRTVLLGNLNGHTDMDRERMREAVCALFVRNSSEGVNALPDGEELPMSDERQSADETEIIQPFEGTTPPEPQTEEASEAQGTDLPDPQTDKISEPQETEPSERLATPSDPQATAENSISPMDTDPSAPSESGNAGEALGIDMSIPWPDAVEGLRRLFMQSPALGDAPDSDHVYISVPLPQGCAFESCAAGISTQNGVPVSVAYAMPSAYAPEPPEGMEDYRWQGGSNRGWWRFDGDAVTGKHI